MAEDKAPPSVAQLVIWNVVDGFDWATIERYSRPLGECQRADPGHELRQGDAKGRGGAIAPGDSGSIRWELTSRRAEGDALTADLAKALEGKTLLGVPLRRGITETPDGPSLAVRLRVDADEIMVQVSASNEGSTAWVPVSKIARGSRGEGRRGPARGRAIDRIAGGVLGRVLDAKLIPVAKAKGGKPTYRIRIDNASPLILNALTLSGPEAGKDSPRTPSCLAGFSLPPHRSMSLPISEDAVQRLGLQSGIQLLEADLTRSERTGRGPVDGHCRIAAGRSARDAPGRSAIVVRRPFPLRWA